MENIHLDSNKLAAAILDDFTAKKQRFMREAMRAWDKKGEGCFYLFVNNYACNLWEEYARRN